MWFQTVIRNVNFSKVYRAQPVKLRTIFVTKWFGFCFRQFWVHFQLMMTWLLSTIQSWARVLIIIWRHVSLSNNCFQVLIRNLTASFYWNCEGCRVNDKGDAIEIENRFVDPTLFKVSIQIDLVQHQHVRQE